MDGGGGKVFAIAALVDSIARSSYINRITLFIEKFFVETFY